MKTVRRLLYRDIAASVMFVALAFLSLFFFIDFVDELDEAGRRGRGAWHAVQASLLELPGHAYELFPIAVLIGTIYTLARMAQTSEFTILRTGGLGPGRALGLLAVLGAAFAMLTWVVGDFVAPASERQVVLLKARASGGLNIGGAGAWLKERRSTPDGERSFSVMSPAPRPPVRWPASASSNSTPTAAWSLASRPGRAASPTTAPGHWPTPRWRTGRRRAAPARRGRSSAAKRRGSGRARSAPTWWRRPCCR